MNKTNRPLVPPRRGNRKKSRPASAEPTAPVALITIVSRESETAIQAILVGSAGWKRRSRRAPVFGDEHGTFVSLGDPSKKLTAEQEEQAWSHVLQLSDSHAQTFLFCAARYLAENPDAGARRPVRITVNELLHYRGFSRHRKGDFRTAHKIEERERLANLADMRVRMPVNDPGRRSPTLTTDLMRVDFYSEKERQQQRLSGIDLIDQDDVPYAFDITLGGWASAVIASGGERRAILASIMRYDAKDPAERMAMRLGLYLHFRSSSITTVNELLNGANISRPSHHPERFRDDYEDAMDRLAADKIIGGWKYIAETELPRYRWLEQWLRWDVAVTQAPSVIVGAQQNAIAPPKS
jgi:hypothetical protein